MPNYGGNRVPVGEVGSFHGDGLIPDAIILRVYEEGDRPGTKEGLGGGVMRDDPV